MSGTFPASPEIKTAQLSSTQPVLEDIAQSGKRQARIIAGHLWEMTCEFPPMTRAEFAPLFAFAISQRGSAFQIVLPHLATPQGVATGTPLVDGVHAVGDTTIAIDGFTPSTTGIYKAGDIIKFSSHTKVYMATADADSAAGAGLALIPIEPPLIYPLADNEAVIINNVTFTVAYKDGMQEFKTKNPSIYSYAIDLTEAI
jgi:hypothetical protein